MILSPHGRLVLVSTLLAAAPSALLVTAPTSAAAPPSNDDIADAVSVDGAEGVVAGTTADATRDETDPESVSGDDDSPGGTVWYEWRAPSSGLQRFDLVTDYGSSWAMAVYTGTPGNLSTVSNGDSVDGSATFEAQAGTTYLIVVAGYYSDEVVDFELTWRPTRVPSYMYFSGRVDPEPGSRPKLLVRVITGYGGSTARGTGRVTVVERGRTLTEKLVRGGATFTLAPMGRRAFTVRATWPGGRTSEPATATVRLTPGR